MSVFMEIGGVMCESYKGLVVSLREMNGYDDSDFYASVWDAEYRIVKDIMYRSTRFSMYKNYAEVDASPAVAYLAKTYLDKENAEVDAYRAARRAEAEAAKINKGDEVTVSLKAGKNKALNGKVGRVFWIGADPYARANIVNGIRFASPLKYGVEMNDTGEKVFLSEKNVVKLIAVAA